MNVCDDLLYAAAVTRYKPKHNILLVVFISFGAEPRYFTQVKKRRVKLQSIFFYV